MKYRAEFEQVFLQRAGDGLLQKSQLDTGADGQYFNPATRQAYQWFELGKGPMSVPPGNVAVFPGASTPHNVAEPGVVELLQDWLAQAQRGELKAVALAAVTGAGAARTNWHHIDQYPALVGAVSCLTFRMHSD